MNDRLPVSLLIAALALAPAAQGNEPPVPFEALYEVYRNGKLLGESRFRLEVEGERWRMTTETEGTRGLAKFLGVEEASESDGAWIDGAPRPETFSQTVKVSFKTVETRASFDWSNSTVHSVHEDGEDTLTLEPGVLDPVSAGLAIRAGLQSGASQWSLNLVDEDDIETQRFEQAEQAPLDTPLGCLATTRVDRVRGPESTRYTRTWYAQDLSWVPVKVAHGKTDGDHMETRLKSLTLSGEPVAPADACP